MWFSSIQIIKTINRLVTQSNEHISKRIWSFILLNCHFKLKTDCHTGHPNRSLHTSVKFYNILIYFKNKNWGLFHFYLDFIFHFGCVAHAHFYSLFEMFYRKPNVKCIFRNIFYLFFIPSLSSCFLACSF